MKFAPHGYIVVGTLYTIRSPILGQSMQYEGRGIKSNTGLGTITICGDLVVFYATNSQYPSQYQRISSLLSETQPMFIRVLFY
jgi:hypothetical protein